MCITEHQGGGGAGGLVPPRPPLIPAVSPYRPPLLDPPEHSKRPSCSTWIPRRLAIFYLSNKGFISEAPHVSTSCPHRSCQKENGIDNTNCPHITMYIGSSWLREDPSTVGIRLDSVRSQSGVFRTKVHVPCRGNMGPNHSEGLGVAPLSGGIETTLYITCKGNTPDRAINFILIDNLHQSYIISSNASFT